MLHIVPRCCTIVYHIFVSGPAETNPPPPQDDPAASLATGFASRADISARSVLVTIFGDSIVPLGGEIWLRQLIKLCAPFQFSERLLRTSMFRLNKDGWFDVERVGRQSVYRLSQWAHCEFADAERRIYHRPTTTWDQQWTLVFVSMTVGDKAERDIAIAGLEQAGFRQITSGVMATPSANPDQANTILSRLGIEPQVPVAVATFDNISTLVQATIANDTFTVEPATSRYREFIDRHSQQNDTVEASINDEQAFVLRTIAMHDFRRARLVDPDLPAELVPRRWNRDQAFTLAVKLHQATHAKSTRWVRRFIANTANSNDQQGHQSPISCHRHQVTMAGRLQR